MSLVINLDTSLETSGGIPIVVCLFEERLPLHGYPGAVDWELGGEMSRRIAGKEFIGREKAKMLLSLRFSCMPERKVLAYGLGKKHALTPKKLALLTEDLMDTLAGLSIVNLVHVVPVLYGMNADIHDLLDSIAYGIVKFTSSADTDYRLGLLWDNVSQPDMVGSFKDAANALPNASLSILEKED